MKDLGLGKKRSLATEKKTGYELKATIDEHGYLREGLSNCRRVLSGKA